MTAAARPLLPASSSSASAPAVTTTSRPRRSARSSASRTAICARPSTRRPDSSARPRVSTTSTSRPRRSTTSTPRSPSGSRGRRRARRDPLRRSRLAARARTHRRPPARPRTTCSATSDPAMSFLDVAWARLGVDPVEAGVRLVDGHEFATSAAGERGPLLVAHTHANWVLSDIKLAVEGATGDESVTILQALGTTDEQIVTRRGPNSTGRSTPTISLRSGSPISPRRWAPSTCASTSSPARCREQCPWDIEQTHESLVPYLLEETYEVVDAVNALDADDPATDDDLIEELGDLLYQIEFHATIAEQEGRFTIADVATGIHDKLVRRHPHVFGALLAGTELDTDQVLANWDDIKQEEKARTSDLRRHPAVDARARLRREGRPQGVEGRLRLARTSTGHSPRSPRRRASCTAPSTTPSADDATSSATSCSPSSTSPATSVSIRSWRCGRRPTSSGRDSRGSSNWPPSTVDRTRRGRPGHPRRPVGRGQGHRADPRRLTAPPRRDHLPCARSRR